MLDPSQLGASLYVPTTHPDLASIASGEKLAHIRSVIFCTEDAVAPKDVPSALFQLAGALTRLRKDTNRLRFVRVRTPGVLRQILGMQGASQLDGFVLPKVTAENFEQYFSPLKSSQHYIMPTLETREAFNESAMTDLLRSIDRPGRRERVLSLRIGGNDLLALLRMRRPRGHTIYETPVGQTIARLATLFLPYGFSLSAPVFEHIDDHETLDREIRFDLNHGLVGKTAIHPSQVPLIERRYRVPPQDLEVAMKILAPDAPGVFELHQSMCEPATHRPWAESVIQAARCYGYAGVA